MTEPRYNIIISQNAEDNKRLEALKAKGWKTVWVYRKGLEVCAKMEAPKNGG
jgi:hypothetical protein